MQHLWLWSYDVAGQHPMMILDTNSVYSFSGSVWEYNEDYSTVSVTITYPWWDTAGGGYGGGGYYNGPVMLKAAAEFTDPWASNGAAYKKGLPPAGAQDAGTAGGATVTPDVQNVVITSVSTNAPQPDYVIYDARANQPNHTPSVDFTIKDNGCTADPLTGAPNQYNWTVTYQTIVSYGGGYSYPQTAHATGTANAPGAVHVPLTIGGTETLVSGIRIAVQEYAGSAGMDAATWHLSDPGGYSSGGQDKTQITGLSLWFENAEDGGRTAKAKYTLVDTKAPSAFALNLIDPLGQVVLSGADLPLETGAEHTVTLGTLDADALLYDTYRLVACATDDHGDDPTPSERRDHQTRHVYPVVAQAMLVAPLSIDIVEPADDQEAGQPSAMRSASAAPRGPAPRKAKPASLAGLAKSGPWPRGWRHKPLKVDGHDVYLGTLVPAAEAKHGGGRGRRQTAAAMAQRDLPLPEITVTGRGNTVHCKVTARVPVGQTPPVDLLFTAARGAEQPVLYVVREINCLPNQWYGPADPAQKAIPSGLEYTFECDWNTAVDCLNADYTLKAELCNVAAGTTTGVYATKGVSIANFTISASTTHGGAGYVAYSPVQTGPTAITINLADSGPQGTYHATITTFGGGFATFAEPVTIGVGDTSISLTPTNPDQTVVSGYQVVVTEDGAVSQDQQTLHSQRLTPTINVTKFERRASTAADGSPPWDLTGSYEVGGAWVLGAQTVVGLQPSLAEIDGLSVTPMNESGGTVSATVANATRQHGNHWLVMTGTDNLTTGYPTSAQERRAGDTKTVVAGCASANDNTPIELDVGVPWDKRTTTGFAVKINDNHDEGNLKFTPDFELEPAADNEEDYWDGHRVLADDPQVFTMKVRIHGPARGRWRLVYSDRQVLVWRKNAQTGLWQILGSGAWATDAAVTYGVPVTEETLLVEGMAASTGSHDVPLMVLFAEENGPGGLDTANGTVDDRKLCSVLFGASTGQCPAVRPDDGSAYDGPQWQDLSSPLDNDADDSAGPDGVQRDHRWPVCYTRRATMRLTVTARVPLSQGMDGWRLRAVDSDGKLFTHEGLLTAGADGMVTAELTRVEPLGSQIRREPDYKVNFVATRDDGRFSVALGQSRNELFVIRWDQPAAPPPDALFHTVLCNACGFANGMSWETVEGDAKATLAQQLAVAQSVFGAFAGCRTPVAPVPNPPAGWEPYSLWYWRSWEEWPTTPVGPDAPSCYNVAGLLQHHDSRCGAWGPFFEAMLAAHEMANVDGAPFQEVGIEAKNVQATYLFIAPWAKKEAPPGRPIIHQPGTNEALSLAIPGAQPQSVVGGQWKYNWIYTEYEYQTGGGMAQGPNSNPAALFYNHSVVGLTPTALATWPSRDIVFDPSYAKVYQAEVAADGTTVTRSARSVWLATGPQALGYEFGGSVPAGVYSWPVEYGGIFSKSALGMIVWPGAQPTIGPVHYIGVKELPR